VAIGVSTTRPLLFIQVQSPGTVPTW